MSFAQPLPEFSGTVYDPDSAAPVAGEAPRSAARPEVLTSRGAGQVVFPTGPADAWLVSRIVVQSDVIGPASVYIGAPGSLDKENIVSVTTTGEFDENETTQPYLVPENSALTVVWNNGGNCVARIEYRGV